MLELPYRQSSHLGQPLGYLVPDDAAEKDKVPSKIIAVYLGGDLVVHGHLRVFCPYMPMQLHQGVHVRKCLQFRIVRI